MVLPRALVLPQTVPLEEIQARTYCDPVTYELYIIISYKLYVIVMKNSLISLLLLV